MIETPLSASPVPEAAAEPAPLLGWDWNSTTVGTIAALLAAAALALNIAPILVPSLKGDDFQIFSGSWTWNATVDHLWKPHNEHIFPVGRISTWLLAWLAGPVAHLPFVAALQGPLAVLLGMGLVYGFVRRETGHPLYGLAAMGFFGVTNQYQEAVSWFSASFGILALDTLLVGLLSAQSWRLTGRWPYLAGTLLASALAPGWFATGILAGPLCGLYLAWPTNAKAKGEHAPTGWVRWLAPLVPILGTLLFLGASLPGNLDALINLEHYKINGQGTAREAIQPGVGLEFTVRSLVDHIGLNLLGIAGVNCPEWQIFRPLLLLVAAAIFWAWRAPQPRLLVLGLGLIFLSYFLIYSARAQWSYAHVSTWSRYQLWAHLGVAFFLAGGLPRWQSWLLGRAPWTSAIVLAVVLIVVLLTEIPRGGRPVDNQQQQEALHRIDHIDQRCRTHHISAQRAREVLDKLKPEWLYYATATANVSAWEFLRGSSDPRPATDLEVLQALFGPP